MAAARPMLAQIGAPVLSAILRKRLAELAGLPEEDLRSLLAATGPVEAGPTPATTRPAQPSRPARAPGPRTPVRRAPSLTRLLILGLLRLPALAKSLAFPRPTTARPRPRR